LGRHKPQAYKAFSGLAVKAPHRAVGFDTHTQSFFDKAKETKPFEEKMASSRSCFS